MALMRGGPGQARGWLSCTGEPSGTTGPGGCHGTGCSSSRASVARTGGCCCSRAMGQSEPWEICLGRAVGQSETLEMCRGRAVHQAIGAWRDLWWQSHRPTGSRGPATAELPASRCQGMVPMPQLSASQHWGDLPQPSCWLILNGGTRVPYARHGSAGVVTACCARDGPCLCLCHGCGCVKPVPCCGWDQDGCWQPRGCLGQEQDTPSGGSPAWGEHFTSLWLWAQGWCGQTVGLFSSVPVPVRGVRAWRWWWHHTGLLAVPSPLPWRIT